MTAGSSIDEAKDMAYETLSLHIKGMLLSSFLIRAAQNAIASWTF